MNMSLADYGEITLSQFFNKLEGFYELQKEIQQQEWERMNFVAYSMLMNNPYVKAIDKPKSFNDYLTKLKKPEVKKLTNDELNKLIDG